MNKLSALLALSTSSLIFSAAASAATLNIESSAGYPFTCFRGAVDTGVTQEYLEGKILRIYYGYTQATEAEFKANPDLAWFNSKGEAVAEGFVDVEYHHDSGYPGMMNMAPIDIKVPSGMNLLFRVAYMKKVGGSCYTSADPLKFAYSESGVLFMAGDR